MEKGEINMIISDARNNIEIRWRDSDNKRINKTVENFSPYFFIEKGDVMPEVITSSGKYVVVVDPTKNRDFRQRRIS